MLLLLQGNQYEYCNKCECLDCEYEPEGDECVTLIKKSCAKLGTWDTIAKILGIVIVETAYLYPTTQSLVSYY